MRVLKTVCHVVAVVFPGPGGRTRCLPRDDELGGARWIVAGAAGDVLVGEVGESWRVVTEVVFGAVQSRSVFIHSGADFNELRVAGETEVVRTASFGPSTSSHFAIVYKLCALRGACGLPPAGVDHTSS